MKIKQKIIQWMKWNFAKRKNQKPITFNYFMLGLNVFKFFELLHCGVYEYERNT